MSKDFLAFLNSETNALVLSNGNVMIDQSHPAVARLTAHNPESAPKTTAV